MKFYDVSLLLDNATPIYPNNPQFSLNRVNSIPKDTSNVSSIQMGSHFGTHIDAPRHFDNNATSIDQIYPDRFIGECNVVDLTSEDEAVTVDALKNKNITKDILVLKTKNSVYGYTNFNENFIYISDDAAEYIKDLGVRFVATDGYSVKKFRTPDFVHKYFFKNDIVIAEGLNLINVQEDEYLLIALPLKIKDGDASPARIILIKDFSYGK